MPEYCSECRKLIVSPQDNPEDLDFDSCSCENPQNILPLQRSDAPANAEGNNNNERPEEAQVRRRDSEDRREQAFALVTQAETLIANGNYGDGIPIMAKAVLDSEGAIYYNELKYQIDRVLPLEAVRMLNVLIDAGADQINLAYSNLGNRPTTEPRSNHPMRTRSRTRRESRMLSQAEAISRNHEQSDEELDDTISLPDEEERRVNEAESSENRNTNRISEAHYKELVNSAIQNALERQRNEFESKLDLHQLQAARDQENLQNEMQHLQNQNDNLRSELERQMATGASQVMQQSQNQLDSRLEEQRYTVEALIDSIRESNTREHRESSSALGTPRVMHRHPNSCQTPYPRNQTNSADERLALTRNATSNSEHSSITGVTISNGTNNSVNDTPPQTGNSPNNGTVANTNSDRGEINSPTRQPSLTPNNSPGRRQITLPPIDEQSESSRASVRPRPVIRNPTLQDNEPIYANSQTIRRVNQTALRNLDSNQRSRNDDNQYGGNPQNRVQTNISNNYNYSAQAPNVQNQSQNNWINNQGASNASNDPMSMIAKCLIYCQINLIDLGA